MIETSYPILEPILKNRDFKVSYYQFDERPLSDSCWSIQTGPDGRIYIACCVEHTGGQTVTVLRYNGLTDSLDYLFDMDKVTGDLRDNGHATQCKIHYSFVPDPSNDILYSATHLSGPPIGEKSYNPWAAWHDPVRTFKGSYLVAYDTRQDKVLSSELFLPKEGCRCLCIDVERQVLYALSYPRDHFFVYDLKTGTLRDKGRLGSVNSQCIFLDHLGRACTFNDKGQMIRYDIKKDSLEELPLFYPHELHQSSWHGVIYDAVKDPAENAIYMVPWKSNPHLIRYFPEEGQNGSIEDLGALTQSRNPQLPMSVNLDHVGGLVFGNDGCLYYVKSVWEPCDYVTGHTRTSQATAALLCRLNPKTLEHEEICTLVGGVGGHHYVSRGAKDPDGNLYFGKILAKPAGIYRVETSKLLTSTNNNQQFLRFWG